MTTMNRAKTIMMPVSEVMTFHAGDAFRGETMVEVLDRKRKDPNYLYAALLADVDRHGVMFPLELYIDSNGETQVSNGHHRLAAAVELGHEFVPVIYGWCDNLPSSPYYRWSY